VAEISGEDLRLVAVKRASVAISSPAILKTAIRSLGGVVKTEETTPSGFGVVFTARSGKVQFKYVANFDGTQFHCEPGEYFKEAFLEKSIAVCKSLKK
jgi:hypothetical protein